MNLIANGSFEKASKGSSPPTGNGEAIADGDQAIAHWTVFGGLANDGVAWLPNGNAYGVTTPYGNDFLDLTGYDDGQPYFGVEQSIKTTVGMTYALTIHIGEDNSNGLYSGPVSVLATAGSKSKEFTFDSSKSGNQWHAYTLDFTATSSTTLISIQGEHGNQYIGLDDVSVKPIANEPTAPRWGASASGFASAMAAMGGGAGAGAHVAADIWTARAPVLAHPHTVAA